MSRLPGMHSLRSAALTRLICRRWPDLVGLRELRIADGRRLESLQGVQNLKGLRVLKIDHPAVEDLMHLQSCSELSEVLLDGAEQLRDIGALNHLLELRVLSLRDGVYGVTTEAVSELESRLPRLLIEHEPFESFGQATSSALDPTLRSLIALCDVVYLSLGYRLSTRLRSAVPEGTGLGRSVAARSQFFNSKPDRPRPVAWQARTMPTAIHSGTQTPKIGLQHVGQAVTGHDQVSSCLPSGRR